MKHYRPAQNENPFVREAVDAVADRFVPRDVALAYRMFKANCGPAALAALLERRVCDVMEFFPQFPERPWTTQTQMRNALDGIGIDSLPTRGTLPIRGVALLQFSGPWSRPGVPKIVHLKHTHWVAIYNQLIYDVNAPTWLSISEWEMQIFPEIAAEHSGCNGWSAKVSFEIPRLEYRSGAVMNTNDRLPFASRPTAYSR